MSFKSCLLPSLALGAGLSGTAFAQTIQCTMDQRPSAYYISSNVTLTVREFDEVSVRDDVIASTGRKAVEGTVSRDDSRRLSVVWEVRNVPPNPAEFRRYDPMLQVRLTIQKQGGAATMTVMDTLYNEFTYRTTGLCEFAK
jgi:hypothetical protein